MSKTGLCFRLFGKEKKTKLIIFYSTAFWKETTGVSMVSNSPESSGSYVSFDLPDVPHKSTFQVVASSTLPRKCG